MVMMRGSSEAGPTRMGDVVAAVVLEHMELFSLQVCAFLALDDNPSGKRRSMDAECDPHSWMRSSRYKVHGERNGAQRGTRARQRRR